MFEISFERKGWFLQKIFLFKEICVSQYMRTCYMNFHKSFGEFGVISWFSNVDFCQSDRSK